MANLLVVIGEKLIIVTLKIIILDVREVHFNFFFFFFLVYMFNSLIKAHRFMIIINNLKNVTVVTVLLTSI